MAATLLSPQSDEGESIVLDVLEPLIFHLDSTRLQLIKSGFLPHLTKTFNEIHNPPADHKTFAALISLYSNFANKKKKKKKKKEEKKKMCLGREQPCLCCQPHSYIRMVQHLIERCLILRMGRDDCVQALARHAGIEPLVTLTGDPSLPFSVMPVTSDLRDLRENTC
ncbi:hypothetical protein EJ110_NYTH30101 [Nymphaea thermarum]|nr:hypothetical protein EJ110_NYTH30101 [Nymphaea thermarum]